MTRPNVWLFILRGDEDVEAANAFAASKLEQYKGNESTYVPSRAEMLDNVTSRGIAPDVPLLFLFKKGNKFATSCRALQKLKYSTPTLNPYYWDFAKNTEAKWRIKPTELRMEFYLDILRDFATPDENVLGIYTGAKFMLAANVKI